MRPGDPETAFVSMLHGIDARDWAAVRRAFADEILIDYHSLFGVPAARISADEHVAGWHAFGEAFDATQHIVGPFIVNENAEGVTLDTHVRGYHRLTGVPGGELWIVAGHYHAQMVRAAGSWRIAALTLTVFYKDGNPAVLEAARARAASASHRA